MRSERQSEKRPRNSKRPRSKGPDGLYNYTTAFLTETTEPKQKLQGASPDLKHTSPATLGLTSSGTSRAGPFLGH